MPAGRPEVWTPEKRQEAIDKILGRIATSRDSIATITENDEELPSETTFFKWKREDEKLAQDYTRAKEDQADLIGEEMLDISDDSTNDYMERKNQDGETVGVQLNAEHVQRSKLRIETRKWLMGKLRPKKYGEFTRNEISGPEGKALQIQITPNQADIV